MIKVLFYRLLGRASPLITSSMSRGVFRRVVKKKKNGNEKSNLP